MFPRKLSTDNNNPRSQVKNIIMQHLPQMLLCCIIILQEESSLTPEQVFQTFHTINSQLRHRTEKRFSLYYFSFMLIMTHTSGRVHSMNLLSSGSVKEKSD